MFDWIFCTPMRERLADLHDSLHLRILATALGAFICAAALAVVVLTHAPLWIPATLAGVGALTTITLFRCS